MPRAYPREFRDDVVAVARRREGGVTFGAGRTSPRSKASRSSRSTDTPGNPSTARLLEVEGLSLTTTLDALETEHPGRDVLRVVCHLVELVARELQHPLSQQPESFTARLRHEDLTDNQWRELVDLVRDNLTLDKPGYADWTAG